MHGDSVASNDLEHSLLIKEHELNQQLSPDIDIGCNEALIARSSFVKLYARERIQSSKDDCEINSHHTYSYYNTHIRINQKFLYNVGVCFPNKHLPNCNLEDILKRWFPDPNVKVDLLEILSRKLFFPENNVGEELLLAPSGPASVGLEHEPVVTVTKQKNQQHLKADFLIAGFARSGTTTVLENLRNHPQVRVGKVDLAFNWPGLVRIEDMNELRERLMNLDETGRGAVSIDEEKEFQTDGDRSHSVKKSEDTKTVSYSTKTVIHGYKSEGFAISRHLDLICGTLLRQMKLIFLIRDPIEWLQSLFNMRIHQRCAVEGFDSRGCKQLSFLDLASDDEIEFEDCARKNGKYSKLL